MAKVVFPGGSLQFMMKIPVFKNTRSLDLVRWIVELSGYTTSIMNIIALIISIFVKCARGRSRPEGIYGFRYSSSARSTFPSKSNNA
jgi:hypothetical protein